MSLVAQCLRSRKSEKKMESFVFRMKFRYKFLIAFLLSWTFALIRVGTSLDAELDEQMINSITNQSECHIDAPCSMLSANCFKCNFNYSCIYGAEVSSKCTPNADAKCTGDRQFEKTHLCSFCYQLPTELYNCSTKTSCQFYTRYKTSCVANDDVVCLGKRKFEKFLRCEFVSGYKWSTALILSITLGGFGVDRFYLGNWQEGIGKLFSFGGLGIWTLIDVILIATGYLKPKDDSIYI